MSNKRKLRAMDPCKPERNEGIPVLGGFPHGTVRHNVFIVPPVPFHPDGTLADESEAPAGVWAVHCTCGVDPTCTVWGSDHAVEIAKMHLWKVGAPPQVVIR